MDQVKKPIVFTPVPHNSLIGMDAINLQRSEEQELYEATVLATPDAQAELHSSQTKQQPLALGSSL